MSRNDHGISTLIIIFIVLVVLTGLVAFLVLRQHHAASSSLADAGRPALSAAQKDYLASLVISDLRMSAAVNFLGDTVTYLDGSITNQGARPIRHLNVELNFVDTLNQVVLRETAHPLANRAAPLQPGETLAFRVTFEHMPVDWNQAPPSAKAVYVEF